ncbi:hypothetical protein GCM10029964_070450 [Kibdelosporangium lantanae]
MTSTNWPWVLLLVVATVVRSVARWWLVAYLLRKPHPVSFLLGAVVSGTAVWTLVSVLLRWPLDWVLGWGGWWLLAAVGFAVGAVERQTAFAMGAATTYAFWVPDEAVLLSLVVPMVAVPTARSVRAVLRRRWGGSRPAKADRPIGPRPRWFAEYPGWIAHLATGAAPAVLAVVLPFPGASDGQWWLRVVAGLLITAQVWQHDRRLRSVTRHVRLTARVLRTVIQLIVIGLAATPLGGALVWLWRLLPEPTGPIGGLVLIGLDVAARGAVARTRRVLDTGTRASRLPRIIGIAVRRGLTGRGLPVYAAVCLFHPAPELLVGVAMLVGAQFVLGQVRSVRDGELRPTALTDAQMLLYHTDEDRRGILLQWIDDSVRGRPKSPDYLLVTSLVRHAEWSSQGNRTPGQGFLGIREPLTGTRALTWLDIADEALDLVEATLPDASTRREHLEARFTCQAARALVYRNLNRHDDALVASRAAAAYAEQAGAPNAAASARLLGALLLGESLGRPRDALRELATVLSDTTLMPMVRRFGLFAAAAIYMEAGDRDKARTVLAEARAIVVGRRGWWAHLAEHVRPDTHDLTESGFPAGIPLIEQTIVGIVEGGDLDLPPADDISAAEVLNRRSDVAMLAGDRPRARRLALAAIEVATRNGLLKHTYDACLSMAVLSDDPVDEYRYARAAIEVLEEIRDRTVDPDLRAGAVTNQYLNAYEVAATSLVFGVLQGRPDWPDRAYAEMFELAERARSRLFLELLGAVAAAPEDVADLAVRETEAAAEFQSALRAQAGVPDSERPAVLERVRQARARLDAVWRDLAESGPDGERYARLRRGTPVSVEEVRSYLTDGVVLVEFFVTNLWTFVFVLRADDDQPRMTTVDMDRDEVRAAVAADRMNPRALRPLLDPVLEACAEGERLCVVPHDALHLVPLHAIEVDGRPLADRNPVSYLPAAGLLRYTNGSRSNAVGSVVMADSRVDRPLAHARVQATEIAQLLEPPVDLLVGDDATVAAVRSVRVWHVACHGEFDQNDPQGSGILLADGRCTVADLMKLRLDCELVTFSACETGLAEQAPGDELIGLTRALIYAGARAVLVSLWRVDEISTSILMRAFYRARTQGVDKVTALSQAQHELRTMTAADAITYCQEAVRHVDEPFTIEQDIANLRFRARDFATAEAEYAALAERTPPDTPRYRTLTASVARARRARRVETTVDYGVRPYQRPYHWAPFVLFGDWR